MLKKIVSLLVATVILFSMNIVVLAEDYVFTDRESGNDDEHALTLGAGGVLTVDFNIQITDGEGEDVYIFEVGDQLEDTKVEVSSDLLEWYEIGIAKGSTAALGMYEWENS